MIGDFEVSPLDWHKKPVIYIVPKPNTCKQTPEFPYIYIIMIQPG